jgi:hypothetical protein
MTGDTQTLYDGVPEDRQVYGVGDATNWNAPWEAVILWVELPFWLMVPDCSLAVEVQRHTYRVDIVSGFGELYAGEVRDSRASCVYMGPFPPKLAPSLAKDLEDSQTLTLGRKCKTVLRIYSRCNSDVLAARDGEDSRRWRDLRYYLTALCEAHLEILNHVIQRYRLATYDYFLYEVSPWDVPVWLVDTKTGFVPSLLLPYAGWDEKPQIGPLKGDLEEYALITPPELQTSMDAQPSPGEFELLDARTFMERGDYSGAVRRITTALEAIVEAVLAAELRKRYPKSEVERRIEASKNDFPGRVRHYEKLSGRKLPPELRKEIEVTRTIRHVIVHRGLRIAFADRGRAQRAVDTGRWAYNWFEDRVERTKLREMELATKSIGRHLTFSIFDAELTEEGAIVHRPDFLVRDGDTDIDELPS